ncbi:membrane protein insertase YidC [Streptomyces cellostaticus]|uniref:membrane protein insertase YidC n=1 Tax=Streptomyces cellostaticus TaxID=67285 RepID=UPI002026A326|nr:membrane protein insertase YidC [Streptomyces cellostaticus]
MSVFAHLVEQLAELLQPLFHTSATAAAIVLFTALVRLLLHPLSRAAARGRRARAELRPRIAELREKHAEDPQRLQKAVMELHARENVAPLSGLLPGLLQLPAFFLLYHLFSDASIGGTANELLTHSLLAAPLGGRWADALAGGGVFGPAGLVYVALFVLVAAVAAFNHRRARSAAAENPVTAAAGDGGQVPGLAAVGKVAPFLSFFTLVTVAVMPLAAALYVVTSATWSAWEQCALHR